MPCVSSYFGHWTDLKWVREFTSCPLCFAK